jgi:hypothetical protein
MRDYRLYLKDILAAAELWGLMEEELRELQLDKITKL